MNDFSLSEFLYNEMKKRDMNQKEFAKLVGYSDMSISHYINCKRCPSLDIFIEILDALGKRFVVVDKEQ